MKERVKVISGCVAAVVFMCILFLAKGYEPAWELWNIPTISPHFADFRVITYGAESYRAGYDPMVENPASPTGTRLNYPRIWQWLYPLGLNESHTTVLGILVILSYLVGICLILPKSDNLTLLLVFAAVLSPAALLGVERANIDLFMFFVVAMAIWSAQRSKLATSFTIGVGFLLKLFPLFSWMMLFKFGKSTFLRYSLVALGVLILYVCATYHDLALISKGTPRGAFISYGMNVYWMSLAIMDPANGANAKVVSYLLMIIIAVIATYALFDKDESLEKQSEGMSLDAFRAGTGIYLGTFVIGNNWDYRLIFLIFTLPQLVIWSRRKDFFASFSCLMIAAILMSFWHMIIVKLFRPVSDGYRIAFTLDELANWFVFSGSAYLVCHSAPAWAKAMIQSLFGSGPGPSKTPAKA